VTSIAGILVDLASVDRGTSTLPELLCEWCTQSLPVNGVGLALMTDDGHQGVVAATDGPARLMEDLQFTLGEGPCLDASVQGGPVLQPDLARTAARRWPAFGPAVLEAGIAAIFAFPLQVGGIRLGVLDLYRSTRGNLDDEQLKVALTFADAAVDLLLHLQNSAESAQGLHPQLADPLGSRSEIHQATGMVGVQAAVGLTEALLLLRGHAFAADRTVFAVARDVVARRLRFSSEDGHHE